MFFLKDIIILWYCDTNCQEVLVNRQFLYQFYLRDPLRLELWFFSELWFFAELQSFNEPYLASLDPVIVEFASDSAFLFSIVGWASLLLCWLSSLLLVLVAFPICLGWLLRLRFLLLVRQLLVWSAFFSFVALCVGFFVCVCVCVHGACMYVCVPISVCQYV